MNQDNLVNAHKAGRAYAARPDATDKGANTIAAGLNSPERDFFYAGFFREQKRLSDCAKADRAARAADYPKPR